MSVYGGIYYHNSIKKKEKVRNLNIFLLFHHQLHSFGNERNRMNLQTSNRRMAHTRWLLQSEWVGQGCSAIPGHLHRRNPCFFCCVGVEWG